MARKAPDDMGNPKDRLGALKVPLHLNPGVALIWMALVFELGAWKYGEFNWRNKAVRLLVYSAAIDRHNMAMRAGEDLDPESGLPHAAHVMACGAIILDAHACGALIDDRFEKDMSATVLNALTASDYKAAVVTGKRTPARTLGEVRPAEPYQDFLARTVAGIKERKGKRPAINADGLTPTGSGERDIAGLATAILSGTRRPTVDRWKGKPFKNFGNGRKA